MLYTATAFACEGASLVLVDLPHTMLLMEERCPQLKECGAASVLVFSADMRQEREVQEMVRHAVQTAGELMLSLLELQ